MFGPNLKFLRWQNLERACVGKLNQMHDLKPPTGADQGYGNFYISIFWNGWKYIENEIN